jgi:LacI family transcriptional regulator
MLDKKKVDGIIFIGTQVEETADAVHQRLDVPIVLVDSYAPNLPFDSVLTDNFQGAEMALNHLIALGHRHIALVGSKENSVPSIAERRRAYIQTMMAHGFLNENYIPNSELYRPDAHKAALSLMQRFPEITAFFACNDDTAAGVIAAAVDLGLKVPRDISVIGFDNIALANELTPPLTTIHVHKNWMGMLGVRFLLERAVNPEKPKSTTYIGTQLVLRKSTAPPRM